MPRMGKRPAEYHELRRSDGRLVSRIRGQEGGHVEGRLRHAISMLGSDRTCPPGEAAALAAFHPCGGFEMADAALDIVAGFGEGSHRAGRKAGARLAAG